MTKYRGLPGNVYSVVESLRALHIAGMKPRDNEPSLEAGVLAGSGILLDDNITLIPVEYNGQAGYTLVAPIGIYLSPEEYAWVLKETTRRMRAEATQQQGASGTSVMSNSGMSNSVMSDRASVMSNQNSVMSDRAVGNVDERGAGNVGEAPHVE